MISMKVLYYTVVSSNNFLTTRNGFLSVIINYPYIDSEYMPSLVDWGLRLRRECERIEKEELWVVSCLCEYYHDCIPYVSVVSWLSSNNFLTTRKGSQTSMNYQQYMPETLPLFPQYMPSLFDWNLRTERVNALKKIYSNQLHAIKKKWLSQVK